MSLTTLCPGFESTPGVLFYGRTSVRNCASRILKETFSFDNALQKTIVTKRRVQKGCH